MQVLDSRVGSELALSVCGSSIQVLDLAPTLVAGSLKNAECIGRGVLFLN